MKPTRPYLSVIVPAYQGEKVLPLSLGALAASTLPRESWELITVDDASTDDTAMIAANYADTVVRLPGKPHGPAYARNRGFEVARGEGLGRIETPLVRADGTTPSVVAPRLSGDGRFVAFQSSSPDLVAGEGRRRAA